MAELLGAISAGIGIAAFALQISGKIQTLRDLRRFTPAEVDSRLGLLSDRLESFRTELLLLQPHESHHAVRPVVLQCVKRFGIVEDVFQDLQRRFLPQGNMRPSQRIRVRFGVMVSRQHVEEQVKQAEDYITGMGVDIARQVSFIGSPRSTVADTIASAERCVSCS